MEKALDYVELAKKSFARIAPFWPLKNLIAVNPLQGLEDLPIEEALRVGAAYFQPSDLPQEMQAVNIETIKWLQAYLDEGQATLCMPLRQYGLYAAWRKLAVYDEKLHKNHKSLREWLQALPEMPEEAITECFLRLNMVAEEQGEFLTLLLTTLPGWASYIQYRTEWPGLDSDHLYSITQIDYIAMRLIITSLLWPEAKKLLDWHHQSLKNSQTILLEKIQAAEEAYHLPLIQKLATQTLQKPHIPEAQLVFCIDVRSEPFRRALELTGDYQTFGFAGFFGIPVQVTDPVTGVSYASCPVLLKPKHEVRESPCTIQGTLKDQQGYERLTAFKRLYQSVKYTFTTPFALVEALGLWSGIWMGLKSFFPQFASKLKDRVTHSLRTPQMVEPLLDNIPFLEQCIYAENALRLIGLTENFAPLVVFCGHGSTTQNNAYATALDCGACGGRHGASNARILAAIMNKPEVRRELAKKGISIPEKTCFIAAEHNTTTDEVTLYSAHHTAQLKKLKENFLKAGEANQLKRLEKLEKKVKPSKVMSKIIQRSQDWSQVRPEWGLAKNSAFIIGPRDLSASLDLEGRCFLHSYDHQQDPEGNFLTTILTAPMVVAKWINLQYFFSTLDNVAYGGGSKITQNITGKIGMMQGNASDLMTGLPLQSVYSSEVDAYHEPQRLMTVVFAPRERLEKIIHEQLLLRKLFGNGWVQITVIDPDTRKIYRLNRDFLWRENKPDN